MPSPTYLIVALLALAWATSEAAAQTAPTPGPINPNPNVQNPQAQPGATMVINPTQAECDKGWASGLKWTKEQFEEFCTKLKAAR